MESKDNVSSRSLLGAVSMEEVELKELLESEVDLVISKAHRSGLNYWQILKVVTGKLVTLEMLSEAEYSFKGG